MRGRLPEIAGYWWDERTDRAFLQREPRSRSSYTVAQVFDRGDHYKVETYDSGGMLFRRGYADTVPAALCDAECHLADSF
jgi:hypothetical protein